VPSYGEWLLSFPKAPLGSVSVQAWQLACGAVIAMVAEAIGALMVLLMGKPQGAKDTEKKEKNKISIEFKRSS
jgi:hypothetical protein